MKNYKYYDYYTLESNEFGDFGKNGGLRFDTYEKAYIVMVAMFDTETKMGAQHAFWYIRKHSCVEFEDENGELHTNECVI